ncbi:noggin-2-like [Tachypleus tridentatus]|uniref:noggin-2-like n=1 Tax=Tachypleus tridentatus TaxID=6853 RepID=UPI003FD33432
MGRLNSTSSTLRLLSATVILACVARGDPRTRHDPPGRLRPKPSQDLPIIGLIESTDKKYDPLPEDLNYLKLRNLMGKNFDPECMSRFRPIESIKHPNGTLEHITFKRNKHGRLRRRRRMPSKIKDLKLHSLTLPDGTKLRLKFGKKIRRKFKKMLWVFTYCPVLRTWRNLGIRFWPQWIREGMCYQKSSCSFPPGMSCKPRNSVKKTLLRWHCQNWEKRHVCRWIPVKYPVITECQCSC